MSLVTTLQQSPESLPQWLQQPSRAFDRASFFGSRTVFYPGSGDDGHPVSVCARAHAAHAFTYVDYRVSQQTLAERLHGFEGQGFRGYSVELEQQVTESVLRPGGWTPHVDGTKLRKGSYRFASITPFAWFSLAMRTITQPTAQNGWRYYSSAAMAMPHTTPCTVRVTGPRRRFSWSFRSTVLVGTTTSFARADSSSASLIGAM